MSSLPAPKKLVNAFEGAGRQLAKPRKKRLAPLSLRLNAEERAALEEAAAGVSLNRYVKSQIFKGGQKPKPSAKALPVRDHAALAQVLGMLGAMEAASSLRELAKAAQTGALPVTPETEEELVNACAAVLAIKAEVMRALGYEDTEAS
ncbi:hypothetical protein [uncultured Roseobacter sp.]|uniref:hypothetical protein n=1 Tax=uncultured Roseobacter sp. TaxID=114847 RepID=UPI002622F8D3|nr:hypothetical protein [uncultured Roseobacter sp.]